MAFAGVAVGAWLTPIKMAYYGPAMAGISAFLVCGAGNALNDWRDIDIDRVNRPNRVLVKGDLSPRFALNLSIGLNALALGTAISVGWEVFCIVVTAIALLLLYNLWAKRIPGLGNAVIALLGGMTFMTGGLAADPKMWLALPGPLIPALFAVLLHLIREIVKDAEDIEGDLQAGVTTLPQILGIRTALVVALVLMLALAVATLVPVWQGWFGTTYEVIALYIIDLPLLLILISIVAVPSKRRLRLASHGLKVAMVIGGVALLMA